ncbi:MAG: hypothetical protein NPINA01_29410 [Nitrospinaceae bacterium]|nr:MAG: hypothetical protein NPINA01_29410 [Nitrospinaceae bacterium]
MKKTFKVIALLCLIPVLLGFQFQPVDQPAAPEGGPEKRKFYEYPGNYGEEVQKLMDKFKEAFGYELVEFGEAWRTDQIEKLHAAFLNLPPKFHRMPGVKGLYRLSRIMVGPGQIPVDDIPAATLPAIMTVFNFELQSYQALVENQDPRVEFYNPLFYEDKTVFSNIVHHEMAHLFDMTHGFPSFSPEWLAIANFRILNLPALDGKPDSDFLYTFLNDSTVDNYAPVSLRHLPTYSRQNLQEDFANSVAAYINYPYFRYSHPARYKFLKERVFEGKEYFLSDNKNLSFNDKVLADFEEAIKKMDWQGVTRIIAEVSRGHYPKLESEMTRRLREEIDSATLDKTKDLQLSLASCLLRDPAALELRKHLVRNKRVPAEKFLKNEKCFRISKNNFRKNLVNWVPANAYFFREEGRDVVQFLDSVLRVAHARGFNTKYVWRLFAEGTGAKPVAAGNLVLSEGGNGAVKIDLQATAEKKFVLPEGRNLIIELGVSRMHPKRFDTFNSEIAKIAFVVQPGFNYLGPEQPDIRVIYPFRAAYKDMN